MNKEYYPPYYTAYEIEWLKVNFNNQEKKRYKKRVSVSSRYLAGDDIQEYLRDYNFSFDIKKVEALGGNELVVLYLTGTNFFLAAKELNITEQALRSKVLRLRKKIEDEKKNYDKFKLSLY